MIKSLSLGSFTQITAGPKTILNEEKEGAWSLMPTISTENPPYSYQQKRIQWHCLIISEDATALEITKHLEKYV